MRTIYWTSGSGKTITLGVGTDFVIEKVEGLGIPNTIISQQKSAFMDGSNYAGVLLDNRQITIYGAYGKSTTNISYLYQHRREIIEAFNPKSGIGSLVYTYNGGSKLIYGITSSPSLPDKPFHDYWKFMLNIECFDPYWKDIVESERTIEIVRPVKHFVMQIGTVSKFRFGSVQENQYTFNNTGDYKAGFVVEFHGKASNPLLENVTTGEFLKLNKVLYDGDMVEISTLIGDKYVRFNGESIINLLDLTSVFFDLELGNNVLRFTTDDSSENGYCVIKWRKQWVGI
jgi:hypothetical protein